MANLVILNDSEYEAILFFDHDKKASTYDNWRREWLLYFMHKALGGDATP